MTMIAIVGMALRFPGANDAHEFWENLRRGVESIARLSESELSDAGVHSTLLRDPRYVRARGTLRDEAFFDADFFNMSSREAALTDPQHRLFLECAWEALERAGYDPARVENPIGLFAGAGSDGYLRHHVVPAGLPVDGISGLEASLGNDRDYLATRVAYKLDLRGPSISVQTACSTSLVAVQLACQSLLGYQCDMALAGGVSLAFPLHEGYLHQPGHILSSDGHCRAFDAEADGPVSGDGVGVVVLKRLEDASADGDHIHAVILASAVNNDGSLKAGYSAPGERGQAEAIALTHAIAGVSARSISYVEAHGTGTPLGDPIEIAALSRAFRATTPERGFCALGSVKTNIGHLNTAAGVASLIKAALSVEHGEIPASLHFRNPNPQIEFEKTPFFVNAKLSGWPGIEAGAPARRAGVSSFGIGGTNAHVLLEQAPARPRADPPARGWELLVLSARSAAALEQASLRLAEDLERSAPLDAATFADVAHTLQVGRRDFSHRRAFACQTAEAAKILLRSHGEPVLAETATARKVFFLIPGQGVQHAGRGAQLYATETVFRDHIDRAAELLGTSLGLDVRQALFVDSGALAHTSVAQPALFAFCYALAQLWLSWGVRPAGFLGHSLGEWVAACLADVFTFEDALELVALRGRLMQAMPPGAMLAVPLSQAELERLLPDELSLAAVNGEAASVASGPEAAVSELERRLSAAGYVGQRLAVSRAFHSAMMDPVVTALAAQVARVPKRKPALPWLSSLTGEFITPEQASDALYWGRQLREPVLFSAGISQLRAIRDVALLEVGPNRTLSALAVAASFAPEHAVVASLSSSEPEPKAMLDALGRLWSLGVSVDFAAVRGQERRRRRPLPTYPFERQRHWVEAVPRPADAEAASLAGNEAELARRLEIRPIESYPGLVDRLSRFCSSHVAEFLAANGAALRAGAVYQRASLYRQLGVLPKFHRLLAAMLDMLVADGALRREGDELHCLKDATELSPTAELRAAIAADYPQFVGLLDFVDHCAASYPEALTGQTEAIAVLYPGGSAEWLESIARRTAEHRSERLYLGLLNEAALRLLARKSSGKLRILEVGGGQGMLTWPLLSALTSSGLGEFEYHFTDVGRIFVDDARREAAERGFDGVMTFGQWDISKPPEQSDGVSGQSFDLVVAYNVVHAVESVPRALVHLHDALAPGGTLALVEVVRLARWDVLTWGLAEGFWYYDDGLREDSPLLPLASWEAALGSAGFEDVSAYPRGAREREGVDHGLVLGKRSRVSTVAATETRTRTRPAASSRSPRPPLRTPYVAPSSELERKVAALCEELLGIDRVGVEDDFFELGADSLVTLRLAARLRSELGREVPAHTAFRGANVASIARSLGAETAGPETSSPVVPLQVGGTKPPFFFVHPVLGVTFPYIGLARELGPDQPFYGLQAPGLDGRSEPDRRLEDTATRYISAIRRVAAHGPYYLGGYSFGCSIAYEMALQLTRAGETVAILALVDGPAPVRSQRPGVAALAKLVSFGMARAMLPHFHDYLYLANASKRSGRGTRDGLSPFLARAMIANFIPRDSHLLALEQPALGPLFRTLVHHIRQAREYAPPPYAGRITLFKAVDPGRAGLLSNDSTLGWEELAAGGLERHEIPGEHVAMLRPPLVRQLAERLSACLEEARCKGPHTHAAPRAHTVFLGARDNDERNSS